MMLYIYIYTSIRFNIFFHLYSISHTDVVDIQNAALMKWKDGFFKATSRIIDITFDGVLRYIECNNVELHIMTDRPYKSLSRHDAIPT